MRTMRTQIPLSNLRRGKKELIGSLPARARALAGNLAVWEDPLIVRILD
jgi:hypothetical protein